MSDTYDNAYLDEGDVEGVYHKILLTERNKVAVVSLQDFDEYDYQQERFLKGKDGKCIAFFSEQKAIQFVNEHFHADCIDEDCLIKENELAEVNPLFRDLFK